MKLCPCIVIPKYKLHFQHSTGFACRFRYIHRPTNIRRYCKYGFCYRHIESTQLCNEAVCSAWNSPYIPEYKLHLQHSTAFAFTCWCLIWLVSVTLDLPVAVIYRVGITNRIIGEILAITWSAGNLYVSHQSYELYSDKIKELYED